MKRFTLILAAALCLATAAMNAQTYVGDLDNDYFGIIPAGFTTNGHPYVVFFEYVDNQVYNYSIYQSDFTTHVTDISNVVYTEIEYRDLNSNTRHGAGIYLYLTQNLFNTDDNFEYFELDGYVDPEWGTLIPTALHIKSTNGSTIWSYNAEEGFHCSCEVLKLENKYYLLIREYTLNGDERYHLYFISQNQGLNEVKTDLPISVFPSIANRNQQITVELGEGNNAKEVMVVNGLGQIIKRVPVEEGQRQITIPAQELNSGLNVVNTRTEHGQGSCKIIVR